MGIDTDTDQPWGEARLQRAHQPIGPFLGSPVSLVLWLVGIARTAVTRAMPILTTVIDRTVKHAPGTVFDPSMSLRLSGVGHRHRADQCHQPG